LVTSSTYLGTPFDPDAAPPDLPLATAASFLPFHLSRCTDPLFTFYIFYKEYFASLDFFFCPLSFHLTESHCSLRCLTSRRQPLHSRRTPGRGPQVFGVPSSFLFCPSFSLLHPLCTLPELYVMLLKKSPLPWADPQIWTNLHSPFPPLFLSYTVDTPPASPRRETWTACFPPNEWAFLHPRPVFSLFAPPKQPGTLFFSTLMSCFSLHRFSSCFYWTIS